MEKMMTMNTGCGIFGISCPMGMRCFNTIDYMRKKLTPRIS